MIELQYTPFKPRPALGANLRIIKALLTQIKALLPIYSLARQLRVKGTHYLSIDKPAASPMWAVPEDSRHVDAHDKPKHHDPQRHQAQLVPHGTSPHHPQLQILAFLRDLAVTTTGPQH